MLLGLVLGVIVAIGVGVYVSSNSSGGSRNRDVVVTVGSVLSGHQFVLADLGTVKYADDQLPTGAFTTKDQVVGKFSAVALAPNTPLTAALVVEVKSAIGKVKSPYLDIPKGDVAVSIPAGDELHVVGGYIQTGDYVNMLTADPKNPNTWKFQIENLQVQELGTVSNAATQGITTSYIVFLTPAQAQQVEAIFTSPSITYRFALKSQKDSTPTPVLSITPLQ
jgi:Flp pilus assembly protein CpaB